jgi:RsiW-degrading membrane proteinase PrsW (M82 family)
MYVYHHDPDKEPKKLLGKLFLWGILTIAPIFFLEKYMISLFPIKEDMDILQMFLFAFIDIGIIEESFKWAATYISIYNSKEFNHPYDSIVYGVFLSLGYALIENLIYMFRGGAVAGILRSFTSIPAHACTGIIMGYFMGIAKKEEFSKNQKASNIYLLLSILMPVILHTLYDYLTMVKNNFFLILFVAYVVFMYIISFITIDKTSKMKENINVKKKTNRTNLKYTIVIILSITLVLQILAVLSMRLL